jgi:hypothetical protein
VVDRAMLIKDVPHGKGDDFEFLMTMLDWEANIDPHFKENNYTEPTPAKDIEAMHADGYHDSWIVYGSEYYSAKELTVFPGRTVKIKDAGAYGAITMQGYGRFGKHPVSAPSLIRFGEMTEDEFFVSASAAADGVEFTNLSSTEPLVILRHFNPGNPEMPQRKRHTA